MAQSNSSYTPWDRLYDGISAIESFSQLISMIPTPDRFDVDCIVSVLNYIGGSLREDRDVYLDHLAANCHDPRKAPLHVLGPMFGDAPGQDTAISVTPSNGNSSADAEAANG